MSTDQPTSTPTPSPATEKPETTVVSMDADVSAENRGDVSAITIARMMGLATLGEVKMVEGKIDLLSTKLSSVLVKLEKVSTVLSGVPTGADLERIDVQVGALRQLIREALTDQVGGAKKEGDNGKKPGANIQSNNTAEPKA